MQPVAQSGLRVNRVLQFGEVIKTSSPKLLLQAHLKDHVTGTGGSLPRLRSGHRICPGLIDESGQTTSGLPIARLLGPGAAVPPALGTSTGSVVVKTWLQVSS